GPRGGRMRHGIEYGTTELANRPRCSQNQRTDDGSEQDFGQPRLSASFDSARFAHPIRAWLRCRLTKIRLHFEAYFTYRLNFSVAPNIGWKCKNSLAFSRR